MISHIYQQRMRKDSDQYNSPRGQDHLHRALDMHWKMSKYLYRIEDLIHTREIYKMRLPNENNLISHLINLLILKKMRPRVTNPMGMKMKYREIPK